MVVRRRFRFVVASDAECGVGASLGVCWGGVGGRAVYVGDGVGIPGADGAGVEACGLGTAIVVDGVVACVDGSGFDSHGKN